MSWDGVPWFVDGASHGAEIARTLAYAASQGGEGIVSPLDCRVLASSIPDGNIHISQGAVAVLNRFPGGASQTYIARNEGDEVVALAAQGSSGSRYDLIAVIIEDPAYAGNPAPPDPATGPYVRSAVYSDVGSEVRYLSEVDPDVSGFALARVKFDASDGTVNQADIFDLREMALPKQKTILRNYEVPDDGSQGFISPNSVYSPFPTDAVWDDVLIPEWASRCIVEAIWTNIEIQADPTNPGTIKAGQGAMRVKLGTQYTERGVWSNRLMAGQEITSVMFNSDDISIPQVMRGTEQSVQMEAYQLGNPAGELTLHWDHAASVLLKITFLESPEAN